MAVTVSVAESHPFSIHDMVAMERVSDPQLSPDRSTIVFVLRTTDLEANRGRTDLWRVGVDGQGVRRLTTHPDSDTQPRFAPDGRSIYFLSTRSGSSQVWRIPADGGEAEPVTQEPLDVGAFAIAPDGRHVAFSMEVFPDCPDVACTTERLAEHAERKTSARVYQQLLIRHWDTWKDGRRSHLFVRSLAPDAAPARDVMRGMDADCPNKPFGGPEDFTFTPDAKSLVFSARDVGREEAWSTNFDLYVVPIDGGMPPKSITASNPAWDAHPSFSPDGKTLAWFAMRRPGYESDRYGIRLRAWPDGPDRDLAESWDRSVGSATWSSDSRTLFVTADHLGQRPLFAIEVATGKVRTVIDHGTVRASLDAGTRLVYQQDHLRSPSELYTAKPDGSDVRPVTRINAERVAASRMGEPEQFTFAGWNDETVHAWVVKPADFDPQRKYPVAYLIHGGPQGSFGNDFHYRWNPQAYAGRGYAAVMVDFHGSTGYGQAFTDSIRGDWGGKPFIDLQKGLAAALERYPWMDGDRVCALGASYGGYMINWIAGQWPDRFRCLVNHDGNFDERMAYFNTEELWFPEWDHEGAPWDNARGYEKHNPSRFVDRWKTPMLVIHGALDFRVVDTQGMATFNALQRRGIPSKFVHFPDENHWVLKPNNSIFWHETVLDWLDRYTSAP
jgi:dipeptidyl aminopeptidase/acylaminoacyl peptidase